MILCPVPGCPDKTGNRSINLKSLYTNCFRCQNPQPHHVKTLFKAVGLVFEADQALDTAELEQMLDGEAKRALTPVQDIKLPAAFEALSESRWSCYWKFCKKMAERKHLGIEDLEEAGAGFAREGDWEPYCIFPVYEGRRTVYYQGRTYLDDGFDSTKKFPSRKDVPYGMHYWVYNLDALSGPDVCVAVIVESILNVLSLRRRLRELGPDFERQIVPVCVFTHRISISQAAKLSRYRRVKEFCILYDSDSTKLALEAAIRLTGKLPKVSVAQMPTGRNLDGSVRKTNDANDDVEAALKAIEERRPPRHLDIDDQILQTIFDRHNKGPRHHLG